jgi:lincosamide nucleotidyltransferase B/F
MHAQRQLIARVERLARTDDRVEALLMYGSFAAGEGDEHSDIEFYVYLDDEAVSSVDEASWLGEIAPVLLCYRNEYGVTTAIFDGLVRGEFHFEPLSSVPNLKETSPASWLPPIERCVLYDRTGRLTAILEESLGLPPDRASKASVRFLVASVANWLLMAHNLHRRSEYARALDVLSCQVHPHLLRLVRVAEDTTRNWLNPARRLEEDLSSSSYTRYRRITTPLEPTAIADAVIESWQWFTDLLDSTDEPNTMLAAELRQRLDGRFRRSHA